MIRRTRGSGHEGGTGCQQSVVKVPRRTESGDAPVWQGATREHTGSMRPRSNVARRDAAPLECSGTFTTGCRDMLQEKTP